MKLNKDKINLEISALIGSVEVPFDDFICLDVGSKIILGNTNNKNMDIYANNVKIGSGEPITTNNNKIGISLYKKL